MTFILLSLSRMSTTVFIAQLLFPIFALITISALIHPKRYKEIVKEIMKSSALLYMVSSCKLLVGTAIILYHNTWTHDRSTLITVLGWLAAVKGAIGMLFPYAMADMLEKCTHGK